LSSMQLISAARVLAWAGIVGGSVVLLADADAAQEPANGQKDAGWIEKRVTEWQPTKAERAFEEIGWASSLSEAESLAKKHGRPIFLFAYDGASLTGYRC